MTSVIGLRTKLNLWQMGTKSEDGVKADKYWTLNEQVMFNISSLLLGHNPYRLWNCIPYIGSMKDNGYTTEEMKMVNEGRKILHAPDLRVSCTCVRVPVYRSHSISLVLEC